MPLEIMIKSRGHSMGPLGPWYRAYSIAKYIELVFCFIKNVGHFQSINAHDPFQ